jgi:hypothetical protein
VIVVLVMLKLVGKATDEAVESAMLSQLPHKMGLASRNLKFWKAFEEIAWDKC